MRYTILDFQVYSTYTSYIIDLTLEEGEIFRTSKLYDLLDPEGAPYGGTVRPNADGTIEVRIYV